VELGTSTGRWSVISIGYNVLMVLDSLAGASWSRRGAARKATQERAGCGQPLHCIWPGRGCGALPFHSQEAPAISGRIE